VKEYLEKEREDIRLRRVARAAGNYYVPEQPKVYFVVRIKGWVLSVHIPAVSSAQCTHSSSINNLAPKPKKILQLLRLLQINNGVFIKVTKATQQMLRLVEPYVTYGYATYRLLAASAKL